MDLPLSKNTLLWILTDGKAGDETQCLGLAEALHVEPVLKRVKPRRLFSWAMPYGPIDPRDRPTQSDSPLAPPFPDILIASGRRTVPYVRFIKRASQGKTFTVFLKDPKTGPKSADLICVGEHDRLRGPNVITTLTMPHLVSQKRLQTARLNPDARIAPLSSPRVAVLVGGNSRHHRYTHADIAAFLHDLKMLAHQGASLLITPSRRTPPNLLKGLINLVEEHGCFFWDGSGDNPYIALLALSDAIVVTADSTNMLGEAAATGQPVFVFEPSGGHPRLSAYLQGLEHYGSVRRFSGKLETFTYPPLDSTPLVAQHIVHAYMKHRQTLGCL